MFIFIWTPGLAVVISHGTSLPQAFRWPTLCRSHDGGCVLTGRAPRAARAGCAPCTELEDETGLTGPCNLGVSEIERGLSRLSQDPLFFSWGRAPPSIRQVFLLPRFRLQLVGFFENHPNRGSSPNSGHWNESEIPPDGRWIYILPLTLNDEA